MSSQGLTVYLGGVRQSRFSLQPATAYLYVHDGNVADSFAFLHALIEGADAQRAVLLPFPATGDTEKGIADKLDALTVNGFEGVIGVQVVSPCLDPDACVQTLIELANGVAQAEQPIIVALPYPDADYTVVYGTALRLGLIPITTVEYDETAMEHDLCDYAASVSATESTSNDDASKAMWKLLQKRVHTPVGFTANNRREGNK